MKTLCYSVRLESLVRISDKCYKATAFDGSEALIPSRFVFGPDYEVQKSDAWWIAAWILERKSLQYSKKKIATFDDNGKMLPTITVSQHTPEKVEAVKDNIVNSLKNEPDT